jgi:hypothetical protein
MSKWMNQKFAIKEFAFKGINEGMTGKNLQVIRITQSWD